ncbi:MAG: rod-binding protein [Roseobacter sp.]
MPDIPQIRSQAPAFSPRDRALQDAAEQMEAGFLSEMLQAAGLGQTSEQFGGGAGEDQFSSLLVQEQAMQMVKSGGIGLAEALFNSLKEKTNDN